MNIVSALIGLGDFFIQEKFNICSRSILTFDLLLSHKLFVKLCIFS